MALIKRKTGIYAGVTKIEGTMTFPGFSSIEVRVTNQLSDDTPVEIRCLFVPPEKTFPWTEGWTSLDLAGKALVTKSAPTAKPSGYWEVQNNGHDSQCVSAYCAGTPAEGGGKTYPGDCELGGLGRLNLGFLYGTSRTGDQAGQSRSNGL
jgi:hypothetical protein